MALRAHFKMAYFMACQCSKGHWVKAHPYGKDYPSSKSWTLTCQSCNEVFTARESALQNRRMKVKDSRRKRRIKPRPAAH
jgi:hypothetical protein